MLFKNTKRALDLISVYSFLYLITNEVKMLLFLLWIIAYQFILIVEKKIDILVLGEAPTDGLDETIITVETNL